jgi:hypothetical protein
VNLPDWGLIHTGMYLFPQLFGVSVFLVLFGGLSSQVIQW